MTVFVVLHFDVLIIFTDIGTGSLYGEDICDKDGELEDARFLCSFIYLASDFKLSLLDQKSSQPAKA